MSDTSNAFDTVAEDYLRARSAYPQPMIQHIVHAAGLNERSRILDVGAGSGQATMEFAQRGCHVVAVDPARRALNLLAKRCVDLPRVKLVHAPFEDFEAADAFDVAICAQAFHWLDPQSAPARFAKLVKPGGHVMLFWHMQDIEPSTPQADLYVLGSKYFRSFPVMNPPEYGREFIDAMAQILSAGADFEMLNILEFLWTQSYKSDMFRRLFRSASNFARLDDAARNRIDGELRTYLTSLQSDPVINYRTCLIEARTRS